MAWMSFPGWQYCVYGHTLVPGKWHGLTPPQENRGSSVLGTFPSLVCTLLPLTAFNLYAFLVINITMSIRAFTELCELFWQITKTDGSLGRLLVSEVRAILRTLPTFQLARLLTETQCVVQKRLLLVSMEINLWGQGWLSDLPLGTYQSETHSMTCLAWHPSKHQLTSQWYRKYQRYLQWYDAASDVLNADAQHSQGPFQKPPFCQILLPLAHSHTGPLPLESTLQEFLPIHTHTHILSPETPEDSALLCFPGGASGKEPACQGRRHKRCGFDPWVGKIPWRRAWQPTLVILPEEPHGQRILVDHSP